MFKTFAGGRDVLPASVVCEVFTATSPNRSGDPSRGKYPGEPLVVPFVWRYARSYSVAGSSPPSV
jgi:hypothetical protein